MNEKKTYIWRLATFLHHHGMTMSGDELADHLNRNEFLTSYGSEYAGGRGTYTLIRKTWEWLEQDLGLPAEAEHVARAFVRPGGGYAYE
jgi:hypothetical protein